MSQKGVFVLKYRKVHVLDIHIKFHNKIKSHVMMQF